MALARPTDVLTSGALDPERRTRQVVERNLEIFSEASRRIPEVLKAVGGA